MPILGGVFDLFSDLDTITAAEIAQFSSQQFEHHVVENHLANRFLYPQSIARTRIELDLDFIILALALKKQPAVFFDSLQNRVVIPQKAVDYFPSLTRLISVILLSIPAQKITELWLKESGGGLHLLGSSIPEVFIQSLNITGEIKISLEGEVKLLIGGQLNLIPVKEKQVLIQFNHQNSLTVVGGSLGLFIDLRQGKI